MPSATIMCVLPLGLEAFEIGGDDRGDGLRAVDASVMPCVPRANTNIPTLMIAEKMADAIVGSDQSATAVT